MYIHVFTSVMIYHCGASLSEQHTYLLICHGTYRPQKFSSCHDFSVTLSLYICSHTDSSCPDCWHTMRYLAISEDLSTCDLFVTDPALAMTN